MNLFLIALDPNSLRVSWNFDYIKKISFPSLRTSRAIRFYHFTLIQII